MKREHKILVKTIDGWSSDMPLYWPMWGSNSYIEVKQEWEQCPGYKGPDFGSSTNRENATAENFINYMSLRKNEEKTIVLFHSAHLMRGFKECMPAYSTFDPPKAHISMNDASWMVLINKRRPELLQKSTFVFIDVTDIKKQSPEGSLNFTVRRFKDRTLQSYAIKTLDFKSTSFEMARHIFAQGNVRLGKDQRNSQSSAHLYELFDYVIAHRGTPDINLTDESSWERPFYWKGICEKAKQQDDFQRKYFPCLAGDCSKDYKFPEPDEN